LKGVACDQNPVNQLEVVIVIRPAQRQVLIRYQSEMGMRRQLRVLVIRIATVHVGKRRLREAKEQCKRTCDGPQASQDGV